MDPEVRAAAANFLRAVPAVANPTPLSQVCRDADLPDDEAAAFGTAIVALLDAFGAVNISDIDEDDPTVSASSQSAELFLASVAEFIDARLTILRDWQEGGIRAAPYTDSQAISGPQFVFLIEKARADHNRDAPALCTVHIAMVVVKARNRRFGGRYLVSLNQSTGQYELPGGPRIAADESIRATAIRELEAELPAFRFDRDTDAMDSLGTVTISELSSHYGAITAHQVTFFQFRSARPRVPTQPSARWAPVSTLLGAGRGIQGFSPTTKALRTLNSRLPGGLDVLGPSIHRT
jgi:hypothetical protein